MVRTLAATRFLTASVGAVPVMVTTPALVWNVRSVMILVPLIVFLERRIEIFVDSLVDVVGVGARHLHFVHHAAAGPDDLLREFFGARFVRRVLDVA